MKKKIFVVVLFVSALFATNAMAQGFQITKGGYFKNQGVDVMAFDDIYPEGHQGGVSIIMNGNRVSTNGDIRLEATPGQWQPVPKQLGREVKDNTITATMMYPDSTRHLTGFNPMIYPELNLTYKVRVEAKGDKIEVTVDLDSPIPDYLIGEWKYANHLASMPILDAVVECLIEKGILTPPKNGVGAEGCWMSAAK